MVVEEGTAVISSSAILNQVIVKSEAILDLIFESNALSSAQLADATGATIIGNVTVHRSILVAMYGNRAYCFLSSSVDSNAPIYDNWQEDGGSLVGYGTHISGSTSGANGFDVTITGSSSLFMFNNSTEEWQSISNTDVNKFLAGTAYRLFIRGYRSIDIANNNAPFTSATLRSIGSIHIGPYSPVLGTAADGFSLVCNPYQGVADFGEVTKSNLTDFIYVWDASIAGNNNSEGYVTVEVSTGNSVAPSPSSSDVSKFIAPNQVFFVRNTATGNGSINFEEADKATSEMQVTVFSAFTDFYINSRLYKTESLQNGNMESDAIGLCFNENFTTFGSDEDASKLASPDEDYAIANNG